MVLRRTCMVLGITIKSASQFPRCNVGQSNFSESEDTCNVLH